MLLCRAQVVLAAAQSPLLGDKSQAAQLIPRLCSVILNAPSHCRHVSRLARGIHAHLPKCQSFALPDLAANEHASHQAAGSTLL